MWDVNCREVSTGGCWESVWWDYMDQGGKLIGGRTNVEETMGVSLYKWQGGGGKASQAALPYKTRSSLLLNSDYVWVVEEAATQAAAVQHIFKQTWHTARTSLALFTQLLWNIPATKTLL